MQNVQATWLVSERNVETRAQVHVALMPSVHQLITHRCAPVLRAIPEIRLLNVICNQYRVSNLRSWKKSFTIFRTVQLYFIFYNFD